MGFRRWLASILWPEARQSEPNAHPQVLRTFEVVSRRLTAAGVDHALIGGLALGFLGIPRGTKDVDLIVMAESAELANDVMTRLEFEALHRTETFSSYMLNFVRVDFLHARGDLSREMLNEATRVTVGAHDVRVVSPEALIGLKLQAIKNDPSRPYDRADIEALIRHYGARLDVARLSVYYERLGFIDELEDLKRRLGAGTDRG